MPKSLKEHFLKGANSKKNCSNIMESNSQILFNINQTIIWVKITLYLLWKGISLCSKWQEKIQLWRKLFYTHQILISSFLSFASNCPILFTSGIRRTTKENKIRFGLGKRFMQLQATILFFTSILKFYAKFIQSCTMWLLKKWSSMGKIHKAGILQRVFTISKRTTKFHKFYHTLAQKIPTTIKYAIIHLTILELYLSSAINQYIQCLCTLALFSFRTFAMKNFFFF